MGAIERLFPFDRIAKGSRIVLYGLGMVGKLYLRQANQLQWCEIVYLMDRQAVQAEWDYKLLDIKDIGSVSLDEYDHVVISIANYNTAQQVAKELVARGVPQERIVSSANLPLSENENTGDDSPLKVLLYMTGGVGDGVTDLAIYQRLVELVPDIVIDIYGEPFIHFLYKTKSNIRHIYNYHEKQKQPEGYDLVLQGSWWLSVQSCRMGRLNRMAPELARLVRLTEEDMARHEPIGLRVQQARILGKEKFWLMSHNGVWGLSPDMVKVDFDADYAEEFQKLGLKKYITINCGADMRYVDSGCQPTKIWPKKYFEEFIKLFKKIFPEYDVIQLGAAKQEIIEGADRHLLGLPFELVTYILKNAAVHIYDESGLVHLATAIGTKCIGLFGPTKPDVFGYEKNINIYTDICNSCAYNVSDWNARCLRGMEKPVCMYSITPEIVMEQVKRYLNFCKYLSVVYISEH